MEHKAKEEELIRKFYNNELTNDSNDENPNLDQNEDVSNENK